MGINLMDIRIGPHRTVAQKIKINLLMVFEKDSSVGKIKQPLKLNRPFSTP